MEETVVWARNSDLRGRLASRVVWKPNATICFFFGGSGALRAAYAMSNLQLQPKLETERVCGRMLVHSRQMSLGTKVRSVQQGYLCSPLLLDKLPRSHMASASLVQARLDARPAATQ